VTHPRSPVHWIVETIVYEYRNNYMCVGKRVQCAPGVWVINGVFRPEMTDTFEMRYRFVDWREYHELSARYAGQSITADMSGVVDVSR
jgi:hypothetical protein